MPRPPRPPGLATRPATAADHHHFLRLAPELGVDDPLPDAAAWARALAPTTLFFEEAGEVVAYAFFQVLGDVGYVRHVVVDPARRGRGLGRAIMDTLAARFREAGCARWCLNVKPDNTPALRLYERAGMERAYLSAVLRLSWDDAARLPRGARAVTAQPIAPADDAAIEVAFGLPFGQLAAGRALPGRILLRLADPAAPGDARVGVAVFDPAFPGAFPFRVAHPSLAAPLLEAMRTHARPEHAHVQVVIEDDAPVTRALLDAGATLKMEMIHLRGALPPAA